MFGLFVAAALAQEPTVKEVHRSEVDVVTPYEAVLAEPTPAFVRCVVRVVIGADGVPISATPKADCVEPWAAKAAEAAKQGRWKLREGQTAPLGFVVPVEGRPLIPEDALRFELVTGRQAGDELTPFADQTCPVQLGFTAEGGVDVVRFRDACPEPLRAVLGPLLREWEAAPYVVDGKAVPALAEVVYQVEATAGPVNVQPEQLSVKRRVMPTYPPEAWAKYGRDVTCAMRVFIDAEGAPYDFVPVDCPDEFIASTRAAISDWRWYPHVVDGAPTPVQFVMKVSYKKG